MSEPIVSEHTIRVEWFEGSRFATLTWPNGIASPDYADNWLSDRGITRPKPAFVPQPGVVYTQSDETPAPKSPIGVFSVLVWRDTCWVGATQVYGGQLWQLQPPPPEPVAKAVDGQPMPPLPPGIES